MFNDDVELYVTRVPECRPGMEFFVFNAGMIRGVDRTHYRWLPNYVCWHILRSGHGLVRSGGVEYQLQPGDMFTLWPDVEIEYFQTSDEPWNVYFIHLLGPGAARLGQSCGFSATACFLRPEEPSEVIREFRSVVDILRAGETGQEYLIESGVLRIVWLCRHGKSFDSDHGRSPDELLVERAKMLIESELDRNININELAWKLQVGRTTLYYAFCRILNRTPGEYLRQYKLDRAQKLLEECRFPTKKIARMSGFSSARYLQKAIREHSEDQKNGNLPPPRFE